MLMRMAMLPRVHPITGLCLLTLALSFLSVLAMSSEVHPSSQEWNLKLSRDGQEDDDTCKHSNVCSECKSVPGCGFCVTDRSCAKGSSQGPIASYGTCEHWVFSSSQCPVEVGCELQRDCIACAETSECGWCVQKGICTEGVYHLPTTQRYCPNATSAGDQPSWVFYQQLCPGDRIGDRKVSRWSSLWLVILPLACLFIVVTAAAVLIVRNGRQASFSTAVRVSSTATTLQQHHRPELTPEDSIRSLSMSSTHSRDLDGEDEDMNTGRNPLYGQ